NTKILPMNKQVRLILYFLSVIFIGCTSDPLDVDVSGVEVNIQFERFDREMFKAKSPEEMKIISDRLYEIGGELYAYYVSDMLRSGDVRDDSIGKYLFYFVSDSMMNVLVKDIEATF